MKLLFSEKLAASTRLPEPPNLLALFAPRDPIPYVAPIEKPQNYEAHPVTGVAAFLHEFEDPKDTPPPFREETRDEKKERKRREKAEQIAYKLEQDLALWNPATDKKCTSDPYKSLFIARINYDTSESKLRREFEVYGPIKNIRVVHEQESGKPRGYAFIEYEHERDMHSAYKHADGKKIDGRRVLVDVERARTVKGWRPRRLGGGLGGTRKGGADVNSRFSGRDDINRSPSPDQVRGGDRRRRSRSRDNRRRRSRSRDRRRRSRSKERRRSPDDRRRRRSRSKDRSKRSRSRDRKRRRSRSPRDRDRDYKQEPEEGGDYREENGANNIQQPYDDDGEQYPPMGPPEMGDQGDDPYEAMVRNTYGTKKEEDEDAYGGMGEYGSYPQGGNND